MSSIEHTFNGSDLDFVYGFNDAHQLISQTISDAQHSWHPTVDQLLEYQSNELNQFEYASGSCGRLYKGYNANGCLVDDGVWKFSYDTENHLISAEEGTTSVDYVYDPTHRQIQKDVDGTKTRYVYSGWQRLADYDGTSDTLQNRFVYGTGLDEPLITVSAAGALTYMHADRLGSIMSLTDNTGAVTNRYAYSPWGESDSMSGTTFGFTGQRFDEETGLYFYKNRHYSPAFGRFLQPDPIPGMNLYAYVANDPLNLVDPIGLKEIIHPNGYSYDPDRINCLGYASGLGDFVKEGPSQTARTLLKSLGADCYPIDDVSECKCPPKKRRFIFVVLPDRGKYKDVDPLDHPHNPSWHAFVPNCRNSQFRQVAGDHTKGEPEAAPSMMPDKSGIIRDGKDEFLSDKYKKYCCCVCPPKKKCN